MQNVNISAPNSLSAGWSHPLENIEAGFGRVSKVVAFAHRLQDAMKATPAVMPHCNICSEVSVREAFEVAGR